MRRWTAFVVNQSPKPPKACLPLHDNYKMVKNGKVWYSTGHTVTTLSNNWTFNNRHVVKWLLIYLLNNMFSWISTMAGSTILGVAPIQLNKVNALFKIEFKLLHFKPETKFYTYLWYMWVSFDISFFFYHIQSSQSKLQTILMFYGKQTISLRMWCNDQF